MFADLFQGYILDKILGLTLEGRGSRHHNMSMSCFGDHIHEDLREERASTNIYNHMQIITNQYFTYWSVLSCNLVGSRAARKLARVSSLRKRARTTTWLVKNYTEPSRTESSYDRAEPARELRALGPALVTILMPTDEQLAQYQAAA